jgi:hypothetical protein
MRVRTIENSNMTKNDYKKTTTDRVRERPLWGGDIQAKLWWMRTS